jgi:hypothetical protein
MYYRVVAQCARGVPIKLSSMRPLRSSTPRSNELRRRALNQQPGAVSWRMPCAHCFSGTVESLA